MPTDGAASNPTPAPGPQPGGDGARPGSGPAVTLRLFASAREAAGTPREAFRGATVGAVLDEAVGRFGPGFAAVLAGSRVWVDGEPAAPEYPLAGGEEIAILPPVSGGAG